MPTEGEERDDAPDTSLSLSEALLAPLNSIFEAQVHASRSFLNFFLQMGFRHKYTPEDKAELNKDRQANADILRTIDEEENAKTEMARLARELNTLNQRDKATLTNDEKAAISRMEVRLRDLKLKYGALYQQAIEYLDQNGIERTIFVPNLALLPFQPLGIKTANFKYELQIKDSRTTDSQIKTARGATERRPWFLIDPKKLQGEFVPQRKEGQEASTDKSIRIEITVGTVDIPYGLHKLLSSMTSIAQDSASPPPENIIVQ